MQEKIKDDTIYRQDAIDVACSIWSVTGDKNVAMVWDQIYDLPPAQPEVQQIDYRDCANAMMLMWMDNVITDGEYNRIMDKLNAHWKR